MNLFTGKNFKSDDCIFDVHSFATELDEDTLRTKVNGGCCDASAPNAPPSPPSGNNTPKAPAITETSQTTNPGTSPTTNTPNPSDPSNPGSGYTGGGYEPPPEVMSNPQAYGYWKALQDLAKQQGDPDRYKDYNVLPDYKQNIVDNYFSPFEKVVTNENHQTKEEKKVWFESNVVPTDDNSFIQSVNSSFGLLSVSAETDKKTSNIYGKAQVDVASTSGVFSTKDGIDVGVQVNGLSASGAVGFQGQDWDCSIGGSVGWQFGMEIAFQKNHFVIDVAFIFGGRIEVNF